MAEEYIKLHKQVIESDIYQMPPLYLRVFERLLLEANHEDKVIRYKPKGQADFTDRTIKRGEQITSLRTIGEWVSWHEYSQIKTPNKKTIKDILDWLISQEMIEIINRGNALETHYRVLKYDVYQGIDSVESNALETVWNPPKEKPINPPNSEQMILSHWNSKGITKHQYSNNLRIALELVVKLYPLENIKTAIDHYTIMFNDSNYTYCKYQWTLMRFVEEKKGIAEFMDDGQKWLSYQTHLRMKAEKSAKQTTVFLDPDELANRWKE